MSKLDTSWFKPENYSSLTELSLEEWYEQRIKQQLVFTLYI